MTNWRQLYFKNLKPREKNNKNMFLSLFLGFLFLLYKKKTNFKCKYYFEKISKVLK